MSTITFDSFAVAEKLQRKGFSKEQTEGLLEAVREYDLNRLVTAEYLDMRMRELELRLKLHLGAMIFALGGLLVAIKYFG